MFSFWGFCNCEMLLCSVEFVLLKENLKAQGTGTIFRTTPNLPRLIRSVLEFWICEILLCALESVCIV